MKPYGMLKRQFTMKQVIKHYRSHGYDDMAYEDPPSNREKTFTRKDIINQLSEMENENAVVDQKGI